MLLLGFFTPARKAVITVEPPLQAASCHGARRQTRGSFLTQKSAAFTLATTGPSATPPGPACPSRASGCGLTPLPAGLPVLTRESFARMSTSLPRRLAPVPALLASRADGGLRSFAAGSARASIFSRPARRSLLFQPACSLSPLSGSFSPEASTRAVTRPSRSGCFRLEPPLPGGLPSSHGILAPFSRRTANFHFWPTLAGE